MADFYLKKGDTLPRLRATLRDADGEVVDLDACVVKLRMRSRPGGAVKVFAAATVIDAANGVVEYTWLAADVDTAGEYLAEWQLTFSNTVPSGVQTVPNADEISISIRETLA